METVETVPGLMLTDRTPLGARGREARPLDELATLEAHPEVASEQRLRRRGAEQHQDPRLDKGDLGIEPGPAGADLSSVGLLV